MSGPIRPPLRVRDTDSSPNVIPVNTIVVSDGDLVDDGGATVTIDTSGSGGVPATPADSIQFNSDPAGSFTASSDLTYTDTPHAGTDTLISANGAKLGDLFVGQNGEGTGNSQIETAVDGGIITISPRTTGEVFIQNDNAAGDLTDFDGRLSILHGSSPGNSSTLRLRGLGLNNYAEFYMADNNMTIKVVDTATSNAGIDIQTDGTGIVTIKNDETNGDSQATIFAHGTGTPILKLENGSMATEIICEANKKLTVNGGAGQTFIFDTSSATGGITWPDGTTQITASSGASFPLLAPDGSAAAPSYSFADDTDTGFFKSGTNQIKVATGGAANHIFNTTNMQGPNGSAITPAYSFTADVDTGFGRWDTNELFFATGGSRRLSIESDGAVDFLDSIIKVGGSLGSDSQVLTSTGSGAAWEDAGGGGGEFSNQWTPTQAGAQDYDISRTYPFGSIETSYQGVEVNTAFFPFIAPFTGDVARARIYVTTAVAGKSMYWGIYSNDGGEPDSLIGQCTFDISSTGELSQSSFTSTITLTKGEMYWYAYRTDDTTWATRCVMVQGNNMPNIGITDSLVNVGATGLTSFAAGNLPASYSYGALLAAQYGRLCCMIDD